MSSNEITNISPETAGKTSEVFAFFEALGLGSTLKGIQQAEVQRIAKLGVRITKANTPKRTGELRASVSLARRGDSMSVSISTATHGKSRLTNWDLAELLSSGRNRKGKPFSTAGWIEKAQNQIESEI